MESYLNVLPMLCLPKYACVFNKEKKTNRFNILCNKVMVGSKVGFYFVLFFSPVLVTGLMHTDLYV